MKRPEYRAFSRRRMLGLAAATLLRRAFAATLPQSGETGVVIRRDGTRRFDVDRLLDTASGDLSPESHVRVTRYTAGATVMLFSIPLVSRASVGSGYAVVEEADRPAGRTLSIQFGAGSYPDKARGLNRLGFIQEAVVEETPGRASECAWFAFMTTSREKDLSQARVALQTSADMVPYSASQGIGTKGDFHSRVDRLEFANRYTWHDVAALVEQARHAMAEDAGGNAHGAVDTTKVQNDRPATFLYMVRRAMLDPRPRTTGFLVFNNKHFQLDAQKEPDEAAGTYFSAKHQQTSVSIVRLSAVLTEKRTGEKTPFRLWYQAGAEQMLPLRFEYQAKSFLRLTFEADVRAETPPIRFAFKHSREDA
jgi:hypothetical protein